MRLPGIFFVGCLFALSACVPFGDAWINVEGTVVDSGGRPISGANVVVTTGQGEAAAVTDAEGRYRIHMGVCPCDFPFALAADAPGFKLHLLSLPGGRAIHLSKYDVTLQREAELQR